MKTPQESRSGTKNESAAGAREEDRHSGSHPLQEKADRKTGRSRVAQLAKKANASGKVIQRFPVRVITREAVKYRGGTKLVAEIGDDRDWSNGSAPKAGKPPLIKNVGAKVAGKSRYVAGHLLNDNMGGQGVTNNLTVLSSNANKAHRGVEGKLKKLGYRASLIKRGNKKYGDPAYDHGALYTVKVQAPAPVGPYPYSNSEKKIGAGLLITIKAIRKNNISGVQSDWPEEKGGPNELTNHRIPNVPPYPASRYKKPPKGKTLKVKLTATEELVRSAIRAIAENPDFNGASEKEILGHIKANGKPKQKLAPLKKVLSKAVGKNILSKRGGRYKIATKYKG